MTELRLRSSRLQWLETEGEVIALDEAALMYLNANPTATTLWRALATGTTREDLVRELLSSFDVEESVAARDVDAFLADLASRGLLDV